MNRQLLLLVAALTFSFYMVKGQKYKQQFKGYWQKNDTLSQRQLLVKWEKSDANDPDLFISYSNYYLNKSKNESLTLGQNPNGKEAYQIMSQDSSKKDPVAFLYNNTVYDSSFLSLAYNWLDKGIKKFPNRLDIRFGKIYLYGQFEDYEKFTTEIISTIDFSNKNKNSWNWEDNKPLDDPKQFLLSTIQSYQIQLYDTGNDSLLSNMRRIAEAVLKYYPDHIESLSNLSVVFMLQKQFDKAIQVLLQALEINPKDCIVLSNIAKAYKLKGDNNEAIKYYQLTYQYGFDDIKKFAKEQLDELQKK